MTVVYITKKDADKLLQASYVVRITTDSFIIRIVYNA